MALYLVASPVGSGSESSYHFFSASVHGVLAALALSNPNSRTTTSACLWSGSAQHPVEDSDLLLVSGAWAKDLRLDLVLGPESRLQRPESGLRAGSSEIVPVDSDCHPRVLIEEIAG